MMVCDVSEPLAAACPQAGRRAAATFQEQPVVLSPAQEQEAGLCRHPPTSGPPNADHRRTPGHGHETPGAPFSEPVTLALPPPADRGCTRWRRPSGAPNPATAHARAGTRVPCRCLRRGQDSLGGRTPFPPVLLACLTCAHVNTSHLLQEPRALQQFPRRARLAARGLLARAAHEARVWPEIGSPGAWKAPVL